MDPVDPAADPVVDSQLPVPGSRMLTLAEVFDLVRRSGAGGPDGVRLTIETKVEAGAPEQTAPREQFDQVAVNHPGLLAEVYKLLVQRESKNQALVHDASELIV